MTPPLRHPPARLLLALFAASPTAHAQSERFTAPDFRDQPGALYAGWDDFASATSANHPDRPGSASTGFAFTQLDPAAFLTSSGNLYSFSSALSHRIDATALPATPATVILQTRTLATAISAPTVRLDTFDGTTWTTAAAPQNDLVFSETIGTGFGAALDETRRWTWTLGSVSAVSLRITFQADGTSQSFQAAALDISPPAPSDAYTSWLATHFTLAELAEPALTGPDADPDSDGLANLLEYALDGDPASAASAPAPVASVLGSTLQLTFRRARAELTYTVQASSDLLLWEPAPVFTSTSVIDIGASVTAPDRVTLDAAHPRRFLRLVVTRP